MPEMQHKRAKSGIVLLIYLIEDFSFEFRIFRTWVSTTLSESIPAEVSLFEYLKDGTALCRYVSKRFRSKDKTSHRSYSALLINFNPILLRRSIPQEHHSKREYADQLRASDIAYSFVFT